MLARRSRDCLRRTYALTHGRTDRKPNADAAMTYQNLRSEAKYGKVYWAKLEFGVKLVNAVDTELDKN